ncbi:c-c chemokine receptor type 6 [Limosa lapponica baueri]|uniref:C-c chemokine receptor type 6 n=1 Tax=Limosa lapponica baueri TaxID=1758121 RepID=A0A2I0UJ60_LIMLA|nr:c-c chemokine receptor type 6 [Limosa lapponica baueri]
MGELDHRAPPIVSIPDLGQEYDPLVFTDKKGTFVNEIFSIIDFPLSQDTELSMISTIKTNVIFFGIYIASRDKIGGAVEYNADESVSEKGVGEEFLLQPVVKTMVMQFVPLQPMEDHSGADIHLQHMEDPTPSRWIPKGVCDPVGNSC